jgi:hypothetical protein
MEGDGPTVFAHACKLGLEGIVSKRKDSPYRSGRSPDWLKMKNSDAPDAVGLARGSVHSVTLLPRSISFATAAMMTARSCMPSI